MSRVWYNYFSFHKKGTLFHFFRPEPAKRGYFSNLGTSMDVRFGQEWREQAINLKDNKTPCIFHGIYCTTKQWVYLWNILYNKTMGIFHGIYWSFIHDFGNINVFGNIKTGVKILQRQHGLIIIIESYKQYIPWGICTDLWCAWCGYTISPFY